MNDTATIRSESLSVEIVAYGAAIRSIRLSGVEHSLVVGVADLDHYASGNRDYFGATVGRFANRIDHGHLTVDGRNYALARNDPPHHLHGGPTGFSTQKWSFDAIDPHRARLVYRSLDGEENYPGELEAVAEFSVDGEILTIGYSATAAQETVANLASHLYFNLDGGGDVRGHTLEIDAEHYLPTESANLPTGEIASVAGSAFDFKVAKPLAEAPAGLDHNYCLTPEKTGTLRHAATLLGPKSGVRLDLATTEPGLQVYGGHKLDGSFTDLQGAAIASRWAVALEPQLWPDAPNRPTFPSARLRPGETYRHSSTYRFSRG